MTNKIFTLTEESTGKSIALEQHDSSIGQNVVDISKIASELNIFTYDVGFGATACCESKITYIDGAQGVLQYRGIPIERLAEKSNYIEICYLLLFGKLPTQSELNDFNGSVLKATQIDKKFISFDGLFERNAHPMSMIIASLASMAADKNNNVDIHSKESRDSFCINMIGKIL